VYTYQVSTLAHGHLPWDSVDLSFAPAFGSLDINGYLLDLWLVSDQNLSCLTSDKQWLPEKVLASKIEATLMVKFDKKMCL
jgi:hypothetical protein